MIYKCLRCNKTFDNNTHYTYHIRRKKICQQFICDDNNNETLDISNIGDIKTNENDIISSKHKVSHSKPYSKHKVSHSKHKVSIDNTTAKNVDSHNFSSIIINTNTKTPNNINNNINDTNDKDNNCYKCSVCNLSYKHKQSLFRHKQKHINDINMNDTNMNDTNMNDTNMNDTNMNDTNMNDTNMNDTNMNDTNMNDTNMNDANNIFGVFIKENNKLRSEVNELKQLIIKQPSKRKTEKKPNNTLNIQNNTFNIQNNITIVKFGNEDINLLTDEEINKILFNKQINPILELIKHVHFNERLPQYNNIKYNNLQSKYINIRDDNQWIKDNVHIVISRLLENRLCDLTEIVNNLELHKQPKVNKQIKIIENIFNEVSRYDTEEKQTKLNKKQIKKQVELNDEVKLFLYNNSVTDLKEDINDLIDIIDV
jgi:uncharacterized protein YjbI with pentapeptide repeats